jgi:tRNA pseudouridine65 synthase
VQLLHRDARLVVADKPSGLAVHRGWATDDVTLVDLLRETLELSVVHPIHRLDRGTSGAIIVALDEETARLLGRALEEGHIGKRYLALVRGRPPDEGIIDHPIPRDEDSGAERVPAVTAFRRLGSARLEGRTYSLVEAVPHTGRLHQIRRHLKHLSHPLVGDVNYGKGDINRLFRERLGLHRLALHARQVTLPAPWDLTVTAPIPPDLAGPLGALGLLECAREADG